MSTVAELIKDSMRMINAIDFSETPTADEQSSAIRTLNRMLDSWAIERLMVFDITSESVNTITSQSSYTIGSGGDFNTTRPNRIESAFIRLSGATTDYTLTMINNDQYQRICTKSTESTIPEYLYYNPAYPLGIIYLYPTPSVVSALHITTWKPFTTYSSGSTTVSLPPGYEEAICQNLALKLAVEYGINPRADLVMAAQESKQRLKSFNSSPPVLSFDEEIPHSHDTYSITRGY